MVEPLEEKATSWKVCEAGRVGRRFDYKKVETEKSGEEAYIKQFGFLIADPPLGADEPKLRVPNISLENQLPDHTRQPQLAETVVRGGRESEARRNVRRAQLVDGLLSPAVELDPNNEELLKLVIDAVIDDAENRDAWVWSALVAHIGNEDSDVAWSAGRICSKVMCRFLGLDAPHEQRLFTWFFEKRTEAEAEAHAPANWLLATLKLAVLDVAVPIAALRESLRPQDPDLEAIAARVVQRQCVDADVEFLNLLCGKIRRSWVGAFRAYASFACASVACTHSSAKAIARLTEWIKLKGYATSSDEKEESV